ncbi:aspartyl/glutamyl-tRNA amidotransferase subunit C [Patescibacteria group bacterium]|nr:aspartyl/glutamyl-tRNA amidotransferase subunit C [Patescibacteria group bacterium]
MKAISKEQVKRIAELAKLNVSGEEEEFSEILSDTIDYINVLGELDVFDTKPTCQVTGLKNVYQEGDKQKATLSQKDALSNASEVIDGLFATDAVFERDI